MTTYFTDLSTLKAQYAQCKKAFFQNPSPRLGSALKQLEKDIKKKEKTV